VRVLDAAGLGGGASGVAAGLLNPFAARGDTALWRGEEGVAASSELLQAASLALGRPVFVACGVLHPQPPPRPPPPAGLSARAQKRARRAASPSPLPPPPPRQLLSAAAAAALLPGLALPPGCPAAQFWPQGLMVDAPAYLEGLWLACQALCGDGTSLEISRERVASLAAWRADAAGRPSPPIALVVCAGAAALALPELRGLPLKLCGGLTLRLAPPAAGPALPPRAPALLLPGASYVAPDGGGGVLVGATKDWAAACDAPPRRLGAAEAAADAACAAAAEQLLPSARAALPALHGYALAGASWGVRALPERTPAGALPLAGRLRGPGAGEEEGQPRAWALLGLGARGLVYHALLGKELAAAVLCDDEAALSPECAPPPLGL